MQYPEAWKKEYGTPIEKKPNPKTNDELRIISLTKFFSKVFEKFIVNWILDSIGTKIDPGQFGGLKGHSIAHYLIHIVNFILSNLDSREPTGILAAITLFKSLLKNVT